MRDVLDVCRLCRGTPKGIAVVIGVLAAIVTTRLHAPVLRAASASEMRVLSHGYVAGRGCPMVMLPGAVNLRRRSSARMASRTSRIFRFPMVAKYHLTDDESRSTRATDRIEPSRSRHWTTFAFTSCDRKLYVINADGSELRHVAASAYAPRWSTDGESLLFLSGRTLARIPADGGRVQNLGTLPYYGGPFSVGAVR